MISTASISNPYTNGSSSCYESSCERGWIPFGSPSVRKCGKYDVWGTSSIARCVLSSHSSDRACCESRRALPNAGRQGRYYGRAVLRALNAAIAASALVIFRSFQLQRELVDV